jgi:hypothetical protein
MVLSAYMSPRRRERNSHSVPGRIHLKQQDIIRIHVITIMFHSLVARVYASSARSSSSEYSIRGAFRATGPSACSTIAAALSGENAGCSAAGSPRKCGMRRAISRTNLYPHIRGFTSAILHGKSKYVSAWMRNDERGVELTIRGSPGRSRVVRRHLRHV